MCFYMVTEIDTISSVVMEKSCVHQDNALSLTALVANIRYELMSGGQGHALVPVTKIGKQWPLSLYKLTTVKANGNRVIVAHNMTILLMVTIF